jgi:hypothetical protein
MDLQHGNARNAIFDSLAATLLKLKLKGKMEQKCNCNGSSGKKCVGKKITKLV